MTTLPHRNVRSPLLWLILPFAAGIAVKHAAGEIIPWSIWLGITVVALVGSVFLSSSSSRTWSISMMLGLFGAGTLHYTVQRQHLPDWDLLPEREVEINIEVTRIFGNDETDRFQTFLSHITAARPPVGDLLGQAIQVRMRRPSSDPEVLQRGATLRVIGQLQPLPRIVEEDSFIAYLVDSGHNFRLRQARWLSTIAAPSSYAQFRHQLKLRASAILSADLEHRPAIVGALRAMLLGEKHTLPDDARVLFLRSGTMHLFAISGLHIGIIALTINGALQLFRVPRLAAFLIGSIILIGYVDLIGLAPSAIRAWIMITCFHGARLLHAPPNSVAAISASALIVLLIDPTQLFSAGFQMSYSIVFMLLLYGVPLADFCKTRFRPWQNVPRASLHRFQRGIQDRLETIIGVVALTWSASLIGIIAGVGIFGWFSPFAFMANLLLVPIAGSVITGGFGSIVAGLLGATPIALLLNHAAGMSLWVMFGLLEGPLKFTAGFTAEFRTAWWGEWGMILVLVTTIITHELRSTVHHWRWWGPVGITVLWLVFGLRFP